MTDLGTSVLRIRPCVRQRIVTNTEIYPNYQSIPPGVYCTRTFSTPVDRAVMPDLYIYKSKGFQE